MEDLSVYKKNISLVIRRRYVCICENISLVIRRKYVCIKQVTAATVKYLTSMSNNILSDMMTNCSVLKKTFDV